MEFVAEANGLGVLFSGFFTSSANISPKIKKALNVPKGKKVAATLVLGYPGVKFLRSAPREKPVSIPSTISASELSFSVCTLAATFAVGMYMICTFNPAGTR